MVVRCPRCQTRFRLEPEKLGPAGVRMRCSRCESIFRVPPLRASSPKPLALVAEADPDTAKGIAALLEQWSLDACVVHGGVEALLFLHRRRPALAILGGHLPGVPGRVLAEVVRRNPELKSLKLIRVATLEEPAEMPEFDADQTLEPGDLPEGLSRILERLEIGRPPAPRRPAAPEPSVKPASFPAPHPASSKPEPAPFAPTAAASPQAASPRPGSIPTASPAASAAARKLRRSRPVAADPEIAAAERLARIIVSDIILYNEGKFAAGVRQGNVTDAIKDELAEGIQLFQQRIPEPVRKQRDFLGEELQFRIAQIRESGP